MTPGPADGQTDVRTLYDGVTAVTRAIAPGSPLRARLMRRGGRLALSWAPAWLAARWRHYTPHERHLFATWVRNTAAGLLLVIVVDYTLFLLYSYLAPSLSGITGFTMRGFSRNVWLDALTGLFIGGGQVLVLRASGRWRRGILGWPAVLFVGLTVGDAIVFGLNSAPLSDRFGERRLTFAGVLPSGPWRVATAALSGAVAGTLEALYLAATANPPLLSGLRALRTWVTAFATAAMLAELLALLMDALNSGPDVWPLPVRIAYSFLMGFVSAALAGVVVGICLAVALVSVMRSTPPAKSPALRVRPVLRSLRRVRATKFVDD